MRITETNTFRKTVTVHLPDPAQKDVKRAHTIVCEFETMPRDELETFLAEDASVSELLRRVLRSVEGIEDSLGEKVDPIAAVEPCIKNTLVSLAIRDAFWEATKSAKKS